jgi:hypothetical protein
VTHGGYRVSALARLDETKEKRLMLLQACGLVPRRLSWWAEELGMVRVLREFVEILGRYDVPDEALEELASLTDTRMQRARGVEVALAAGAPA